MSIVFLWLSFVLHSIVITDSKLSLALVVSYFADSIIVLPSWSLKSHICWLWRFSIIASFLVVFCHASVSGGLSLDSVRITGVISLVVTFLVFSR